MSYRDPNEALRAENESLQQRLHALQEEENERLRQQLREAEARLGGAREGGGARAAVDDAGQRWAMGMRCLGGVALMLPFLLMTAVCERRVMPRRVMVPMASAAALSAPAGGLVEVPRPYVAHACQQRMNPAPGFESFTRSVERSARVVEANNAAGVAVGTPCTVRVVPVAMQDFNCHVEVVCNGATLYGTLPTGYAHCTVEGPDARSAEDSDVTGQDGDPAIHVDLAGNRAVVLDRANGQETRVRLALDVPPALD